MNGRLRIDRSGYAGKVATESSMRREPDARGIARARSCLVVDDEPVLAEAIEASLRRAGIASVRHVRRSDEAILLTRRERPDLVLVDVDPADGPALRLPASLRSEPPPRVVAMTETSDPAAVEAVRRHGFDAHLTKDIPLDRFAERVGAVVSGGSVEPPAGAAVGTGSALTPREREVLAALLSGASDHAVARSLGISPHTVRSHVRNVLRKLGVRTRTEAVVLAVRGGLV